MFFVNAYFFTAVNLLLAGLKQPLAIAEGGEKGLRGKGWNWVKLKCWKGEGSIERRDLTEVADLTTTYL